ncbi:hypothetical protein A6S26_28340 [Nostoc sp. ATCC 43529]|nr:hypothetical protein A6S26_28340 [Nostoc sp. ATCC 43529]
MINQSYLNWYWRLGLLISLSFITNFSAIAQVTSDQTSGTQVTDIGLGSYISGGTTVGNTNLFHSFSSFSVPNNGGAIFLNDFNISNIFARVTGGTASNIQGLIYAQGSANGGNITLNANTIIALEDSDILAFAPEGQGGNITFNTRALLTSPLYRPTQTSTDTNTLQSLNNNDRTDINASGAVSGNIIGVPDITFIQNSITELQSNPIDTNALIANSCIARNPKQEGTFLITGAGGLPARPGNALASTYATGNVQNVTNHNATHQWKKGDLIVEPQGVYRLANGQLVMSRECG